MGRYYNGDIEGKFMFAVQSSTAADRFGSEGFNNYVDYYFDESHLGTISKELSTLKPAWEKVTEFFKDKDYWNSEQQVEAGLSNQEMSDYADYRLGKQIEECIKKEGECNFQAEL